MLTKNESFVEVHENGVLDLNHVLKAITAPFSFSVNNEDSEEQRKKWQDEVQEIVMNTFNNSCFVNVMAPSKKRKSRLTRTEQSDGKLKLPRNVIGQFSVALPGHNYRFLVVKILPKAEIPFGILWRMHLQSLSPDFDKIAKDLTDDLVNVSSAEMSEFETVFYFGYSLCKRVEDLLNTTPLYAHYNFRSKRAVNIRGSLNFAAQTQCGGLIRVGKRYKVVGGFWCRYQELGVDVIENQLIKSALIALHNLCCEDSFSVRARNTLIPKTLACLDNFNHVSPINLCDIPKNVTYSSDTSPMFRDVCDRCVSFLRWNDERVSRGGTLPKTIGLTNMLLLTYDVFEEWVRVILNEFLREKGWVVEKALDDAKLEITETWTPPKTQHQAAPYKPDLLFRKESSGSSAKYDFLGDVKYQDFSNRNHDWTKNRNQIVTYMSLLHLRRGVLVYLLSDRHVRTVKIIAGGESSFEISILALFSTTSGDSFDLTLAQRKLESNMLDFLED